MNDIDKMPGKCRDCAYWESCAYPYVCPIELSNNSTELSDNSIEVFVKGKRDTISRQAAIKAICEDGTWLESQGCTEITMAERKQRDADILSDLPTVQPNHNAEPGKMVDDLISTQPKHGKWKTAYLDHEAMGERPRIYYCSVCCQCIAYPTNFCPNCGANMMKMI